MEARALLAAVDAIATAGVAKASSRFLALTAVRLAAVRGARWNEIEDLDGDEPVWRVPAARMKLVAAKKLDPANDHLVPLSRQAAELLRENGYDTRSPDALIFPGRGGAAPIGEAAIGALYDRAGFADRHVPHGWRATYSTILNELYPSDRAVIDQALAHSPKDKIEAAYNRAGHAQRRRELFQIWADLLESGVIAGTAWGPQVARCSRHVPPIGLR